MALSRLVPATALVVLALVLGSCGTDAPAEARHSSSESAAARAPVVRVVAAGDIACPPGLAVTPTQCQQGATAALARRLGPSLVLTLGDHQYDTSSPAEFAGSYAKSWGALRPITRPTIGNHEYLTPGAKGYYTYFRNRQPGPPGYYRLKVGAWQVFVLNSNCDKIDCRAERNWLKNRLITHPSRCSLMAMHHPRFSSGKEHGSNAAMKPFWDLAQRYGADLVLAGHDHDYERFRVQDSSGHADPEGMQELVVGTGGKSLYPRGVRAPGSLVFENDTFGVLKLTLRPLGWSWQFRDTALRVIDSGSATCR
jgi:hypothetical protein